MPSSTPRLQLREPETVPLHRDREILHRISDSLSRRVYEARIEQLERERDEDTRDWTHDFGDDEE